MFKFRLLARDGFNGFNGFDGFNRLSQRVSFNAHPHLLRLSRKRLLYRTNVGPLGAVLFLSSSPFPRAPENDLLSKNNTPPPITSIRSKPKIDLRLETIKPKASNSPVDPPHFSHSPLNPSPRNVQPLKVRDTAKRDIEAAEHDGILTPPPPNLSWFRKTLHKGIQLFKFYVRGVKLIFAHRTEALKIKSRVQNGGHPLTRAENRFIRTQEEDMKKVIPFLVICILLEEIIPLIVIYAPFLLPSTCILPSQRDRIAEKNAEKAILFSHLYRDLFNQIASHQEPEAHLSLDNLKDHDSSVAVCGLLRLPTMGFNSMRVRRIRRHLEFIRRDDELLIQDKLLGRLSEEELNETLEERGIITQGLSFQDKTIRLRSWIDSVSRPPLENQLTRRLFLLIQMQ